MTSLEPARSGVTESREEFKIKMTTFLNRLPPPPPRYWSQLRRYSALHHLPEPFKSKSDLFILAQK
jgi:hypothetical protein